MPGKRATNKVGTWGNVICCLVDVIQRDHLGDAWRSRHILSTTPYLRSILGSISTSKTKNHMVDTVVIRNLPELRLWE